MTRPFGVLCLAALLALTACPAKTDYGQGCKMTKPKGAATEACVEIPNNDNICGIGVSELSAASFDYISLGNAECDDQVCLRTAINCTSEANCPNSLPCTNGYCSYADETNGNAVGYCTRSCVDNTDCQPDYQGGKELVCTPLLFSKPYLDLLQADCATDANCLYNQIFGSGVSTSYCLRPRTKQ
ncbi:MAG TPA: hypothetical protein VGK67_25270 [Myxococcales bacterium]|jgi:hypothetical protein